MGGRVAGFTPPVRNFTESRSTCPHIMPNRPALPETCWRVGGVTGTLTRMDLTENRWRALARSSPWRWRTIHLSFKGAGSASPVMAWIRRPGEMRVVVDGQVHVVSQGARAVSLLQAREGGEPVPTDPPHLEPVRDADAVIPVRDDDRFVALRPRWPAFEADDPMWQSYQWVAMLDPVELADGADDRDAEGTEVEPVRVLPEPFPELRWPTFRTSDGTEIHDLRVTSRRGRVTWWARVRPLETYAPRCGCCPLLRGEISERHEHLAGGPTADPPMADYPVSYEVALDLQTGVCVALHPSNPVARADLGFDVTIHEVNVDYPDDLFTDQR